MNEQPSNPVREMILREMAATKAQLEKDFKDIHPEDDISTIPESIFIKHFLPKLSGKEIADDDFIATWILIAGGMFNPIKIINSENKHVATIPPYKDRDSVITVKQSVDINEIMQDFSSMQQISPKAADARLSNDLTEKYLANKQPVKSKLTRDWEDLIAMYTKEKVNSTKPQVASSVIDEDMEFE